MKRAFWIILLGLVLIGPGTASATCILYDGSDTLTDEPTNAIVQETCTSTRGTRVSLADLISGEDQTNNVLRVEGQFSYSGNKTADTQVKASAGYVHNLVCIGTDAAATAGTIILYDNTAESGTVVMSWAVQAAAYAQPVVFPLDVVMTTGIYLGFTTTADVTCTVSYR